MRIIELSKGQSLRIFGALESDGILKYGDLLSFNIKGSSADHICGDAGGDGGNEDHTDQHPHHGEYPRNRGLKC